MQYQNIVPEVNYLISQNFHLKFYFFYYENGKLREIQSYSAGVKHGDWKKYLETGELYFTVTYDQGKEVKYDGEALDDNEIIKE